MAVYLRTLCNFTLIRRSLPASMLGITGEEEGNNADNESLSSYFSNTGYDGLMVPPGPPFPQNFPEIDFQSIFDG